ncbi:hypothetical protein EV360DRAFT_65676 [Lentinula raphanica]|nr:hypothetical protein EV360DRAFT_65676 [Lentinula raphanica]
MSAYDILARENKKCDKFSKTEYKPDGVVFKASLNSPHSSQNGTPMRTRLRRRLSPSHTLLGPSFNGTLTPQLQHQVPGFTTGLYFGRYQAIAEKKRFSSTLSSRNKHQRFIDVRDGFSSETEVDDIYLTKVVVDKRRFLVCGTYDQTSPDTNESLKSFNVHERFKGDIVIFFYSVYEPERFLEYVPRFQNVQEREEVHKKCQESYRKPNHPTSHR